jgi:hypothetical protein
VCVCVCVCVCPCVCACVRVYLCCGGFQAGQINCVCQCQCVSQRQRLSLCLHSVCDVTSRPQPLTFQSLNFSFRPAGWQMQFSRLMLEQSFCLKTTCAECGTFGLGSVVVSSFQYKVALMYCRIYCCILSARFPGLPS